MQIFNKNKINLNRKITAECELHLIKFSEVLQYIQLINLSIFKYNLQTKVK